MPERSQACCSTAHQGNPGFSQCAAAPWHCSVDCGRPPASANVPRVRRRTKVQGECTQQAATCRPADTSWPQLQAPPNSSLGLQQSCGCCRGCDRAPRHWEPTQGVGQYIRFGRVLPTPSSFRTGCRPSCQPWVQRWRLAGAGHCPPPRGPPPGGGGGGSGGGRRSNSTCTGGSDQAGRTRGLAGRAKGQRVEFFVGDAPPPGTLFVNSHRKLHRKFSTLQIQHSPLILQGDHIVASCCCPTPIVHKPTRVSSLATPRRDVGKQPDASCGAAAGSGDGCASSGHSSGP